MVKVMLPMTMVSKLRWTHWSRSCISTNDGVVAVIMIPICWSMSIFLIGSPGDLLHGPQAGVDWHTRYKIALGAAQGQAYLHHDYVPYIVQKDMKYSNILLDEDYGAHVADFWCCKNLAELWQGGRFYVCNCWVLWLHSSRLVILHTVK